MEPSSEDMWEKLDTIEREVNRRFDEIENEIQTLKETRKDDERFLKLSHAVDYLLENSPSNYETLACREMVLSLLGQRAPRPFSGRTIRNRLLRQRMKRWCFFIAFVLLSVCCLSLYGLHRHWCYSIVAISLLGSFISSIGLRRIYKIIDVIW